MDSVSVDASARTENGGSVKPVPLYAFLATIVFLVGAVFLVIYAPANKEGVALVIGIIISTIPSMVAAFASEKVSRDIRNGVVEEKAKAGATAAIAETHVVTTDSPLAGAGLVALNELLERTRKENPPNG